MSFDSIAPFYRALETVVFGNVLQQARTAFISEINAPACALIVGEGNGRFLEKFTGRFPRTEIDSIDSSYRMLELAQRRASGEQVHFIHGDILNYKLSTAHYDCIVTNFVLDCFDEQELTVVIERLAASATGNARWLIAEFAIPSNALRLLARPLIATMYAFFRLTTRISATRLLDYRPYLTASGFRLMRERGWIGGIVRAELWRRI